MGKLHELLAVESELKSEAQRALYQVVNMDSSKYMGQIRTYQPLEEGGEGFDDQITQLVTTVSDELFNFQAAYAAWIDAAIQKECTNVETAADVTVGKMPIFTNLPAPALLNLESKLAEIRKVYAALPTNDPAKQWEWDSHQGCFVSRPQVQHHTKKVPKAHVLYEATPEHPAQVQVFTEDVRMGTWTTIVQSGMISPTKKREMLARVDDLIRAVKAARQRANDIEIKKIHIGVELFEYIHGAWEPESERE